MISTNISGEPMSFHPFLFLRRALRALWLLLDGGRRLLTTVLFWCLVVFLLILLFGGSAKTLDAKTALVLEFNGRLVEQEAGGVRQALLLQTGNDKPRNTQLRDVLVVLDAAAKDPQIGSVVLLLDDFKGGGLALLREVGAALERFKASGKPVVAWGSRFDQRQYYLAAHANQLLLHPMGMVLLDGFGQYRSYYREALERLGITVNLMRVGTYKSFAEPFIADGPSPEAIEADNYLYSALWETYTGDVEKARKLPPGALMRDINALPQLLQQAGGDVARLALSAKLVDGLKTRDEAEQMLIAAGAKDERGKSFRQVSFDDYLAMQQPKGGADSIAVVMAVGEITDGKAPPGMVGGVSTANLIRKARENAQIKALVLRVDSPGGSVLGSELIRRELELTRAAGKPVVVSMGSVAASGGYWISPAADEVMADAATVTGSIGVFALVPTADRALEKLGIRTGGVSTTWLGGGYDLRRPLDPRLAEMIQTTVNHIYADFTGKVARARNSTPEKIDAVAQGRVWTGVQAKERGLVDRIGGFREALAAAAARAKLGAGYNVTYLEREMSSWERLLRLFDAEVAQALAQRLDSAWTVAGVPPAARGMAGELAWLADLTEGRKAFMAVAHCLCGRD
jgi:protease-4